MMGNSLIFSFFFAINLLLLSYCSSQASSLNNTDDTITIQGDDVSGSRSARQYMLPGLLMSYKQTPLNPFAQWLYAPTNSVGTMAEPFDVEYDGRSLFNKKFETDCGAGPAALPQRQIVGIVGGSEAVKNSWPFMVGIRFNGFVACGGSLISPNKVLTAAHCVDKNSLLENSKMTVSLGMHTVGNKQLKTANDAQVTRRVSRVIIHNDYNSKTNANDIAILTLDAPVPFSAAISPVCLAPPSNNPDQYANKQVAAMGWGRLKEGGDQPDVLQQTTLQIITNAQCKKTYQNLFTNMVCTIADGKDTCQGDSGGPIVIRSTAGLWTQVGIVSFGFGCARPDVPGVYVRVSAFRNWIDKYA